MASSYRVNVRAILKETRGLHDAFTDEGVVRFGSCAARIVRPGNAAKPQALETTRNEMMDTKGLKFQHVNATARTAFGSAANRSPTHKVWVLQISFNR